MDMYNSVCSSSNALIDQIARQIFDILSEHGPVMVIIDRAGNFWLSNPEEFGRFRAYPDNP